MASTFKRFLSRSVGVTATRVGGLTVPGGATETIIGLSLANIIANQPIAVDVYLFDSVNQSTYLLKGGPVPAGGTLAVIGGDQKVVLMPGDGIFVVSTVAASLDVIMSVLEQT